MIVDAHVHFLSPHALDAARRLNLALPGDRVVITAGVPAGITGNTNMLQVRTA